MMYTMSRISALNAITQKAVVPQDFPPFAALCLAIAAPKGKQKGLAFADVCPLSSDYYVPKAVANWRKSPNPMELSPSRSKRPS